MNLEDELAVDVIRIYADASRAKTATASDAFSRLVKKGFATSDENAAEVAERIRAMSDKEILSVVRQQRVRRTKISVRR